MSIDYEALVASLGLPNDDDPDERRFFVASSSTGAVGSSPSSDRADAP